MLRADGFLDDHIGCWLDCGLQLAPIAHVAHTDRARSNARLHHEWKTYLFNKLRLATWQGGFREFEAILSEKAAGFPFVIGNCNYILRAYDNLRGKIIFETLAVRSKQLEFDIGTDENGIRFFQRQDLSIPVDTV